MDWSSITSYLMKADPDGNQTYYEIEPLTTTRGVDYTHVFSDGSFLISAEENAVHYTAAGDEKRLLLQGKGYYDNSLQRLLVAAGWMEYLALAPEKNGLLRFSMETDTVSEKIPMVTPESGLALNGALALDAEGNVYMCNPDGIHYWKKGGSIWETLVDGSLSSLSLPTRNILGLLSMRRIRLPESQLHAPSPPL